MVDVELKKKKKGDEDYQLTVYYTEGEPIAEEYQANRQKNILKRYLKEMFPLSLQNLKTSVLS